MNDHFYVCERCGERVPVDACTMVADTILCPDCVDTYTTVCDCCGERLFLSDDHGDENITLCERCYERHYTHCERCGRVISYSDATTKMMRRTNRCVMTACKLVCSRRRSTITATHRG